MTKNILQLNLIKNIQNRKENSSTFWFTRMSNRGYKQFYLNRHGINFIQSYIPTSLKKTIQYSQITACFFCYKQRIRAQVQSITKNNSQQEIMTDLQWEPKLKSLIEKNC